MSAVKSDGNVMRSERDFAPIIPTAFLTAYPRTFTDIPYSVEIFAELERMKREEGVEFGDDILAAHLAPGLEARYKIVNRILDELAATQVLELAAGLSSRGAVMTARDADVVYIELDLPDMASLKSGVLDCLGLQRGNLHVCGGSILDESAIDAAIRMFDKERPLVVVSEGILGYLDFDEKALLAQNVADTLRQFKRGWWISNDAPASSGLNRVKRVARQSTRQSLVSTQNFSKDLFDDLEHFKDFFGGLGFSVDVRDLDEVVSELTSPRTLDIDESEVRNRLSKYSSVAIMSLGREEIREDD